MPSRRRQNRGSNPNYNNPGQPGFQVANYPQGPRNFNNGNNGNNNRQFSNGNGNTQGHNRNDNNWGNNRNNNNNTFTNRRNNNGNNQRNSGGNGQRNQRNSKFDTRPCYWCQGNDHIGYECPNLGCLPCEQQYPNELRKFQKHTWIRCRENPQRLMDYQASSDGDLTMTDVGEVSPAAQPLNQPFIQSQTARTSEEPCFKCGMVGHTASNCPEQLASKELITSLVPRAMKVKDLQLEFNISEEMAQRILQPLMYDLERGRQVAEFLRREIVRFQEHTGMTVEQTNTLLEAAGWDPYQITWRFGVLYQSITDVISTFATNAGISFDDALICYREAQWNAGKAEKVWKKYKLSSETSMKPDLAKRVLKHHNHDYSTASRAANAIFEDIKTETGMTDADTKTLLNANNWDKAAAMDEFKKVARATLIERVSITEAEADFYLEQGKWNQIKAAEAYKVATLDTVHVRTGFDLDTANIRLNAVNWNLAAFRLSLVQELHGRSGLSLDTCLMVLESQGGHMERAAQELLRKKATATARDYITVSHSAVLAC